MKTLTYNKLLKYALLLVTLATLILGALFFFIPKKLTASADEPSTVATGDFQQKDMLFSVASNGDLQFESSIFLTRASTLSSTIVGGRKEVECNDPNCYEHYKEYYVVSVVTTDLTSYYNCLNYNYTDEQDVTFNVYESIPDYKLNDYLFSNNNVVAEVFACATPTYNDLTNANNIGVSNYCEFNSYSNSTIPFKAGNSNTKKYLYSFVLELECNRYSNGTGMVPHTYVETKYKITNKTENYLEFNYKDSIENIISTNSNNEDLIISAQKTLGCYNPGNTTINVNYLKMKSLTEYEQATVSFTMEGLYAQNKNEVIRSLYNSLASQGFDNLSAFNATFTDTFVDGSGIKHQLYEKTVRTAIDLKFNPDFSQNLTQTVNVVYQDFDYSNLVLYVSNNGYEIDSELLVMPVYTSQATTNEYGEVTVTFNFDNIENQLKTTLTWLFELKKDNVQVNGVNNGVNVKVTNNDITIKFSLDDSNKLFGLSLTALAEIIPDYQLTYRFNYAELDKDLNETIKTSAPYTVWYSEFVDIKYSYNFYTIHGDVIDSAINPSVLNGQKFYTFKSVTSNIDKENATALINVEYNYKTMFKAVSSAGEIYYTPVSKSNLIYKFNELNFVIPENYRVSNITGNDGFTLEYNDVNPAESVITVGVATNLKKLLTLNVTITDKWIVKVDYLEPYKKTPFAELKTETIEAKIADFNKSIYDFNTDDVQKLLNKSTLTLLASQPDKINVTFDNVSTYTIRIDYSFASVTQIDYDGNQTEIKVPLTSYAEWLAFYGKDWSILFLNNQQEKYFTYSNEITPDKLYGYFSVAVFEEQVSDLNYYFQNNTGDGCMSFYNSKEVKGSDLYKFFGGLQDSVLFGTGYVGMALCELVNNENAIYESYFFFLDNTSDLPFISNGGADGQDDTDSAIGNTGEDIADGISKNLNSLSDWWENSEDAKTIKIILYVALGILLLGLIFWVLKKIGLIK